MSDPCRSKRTDKIIVVKENRRRFQLNNPDQHKVVHVIVDDCLITDGERCDHLLELDGPPSIGVFIELKGADLKKAVGQLRATMDAVSKTTGYARRICYVVVSRVPRAGPSVQVLVAALKRSHQATLRICGQEVTVSHAELTA